MTLLIFDIDGTLTNTKEVDDKCFITAFQDEFKVTLPNTDWATFTDVTDSGLFTELFKSIFTIEPSEKEKQNFQKRFLSYLEAKLTSNQEGFKAVEGAIDFISYCQGYSNYKIAFATGAWHQSAELKLQTAHIYHRDIPLIGCDSHFRRQDILLEAIEQSKTPSDIKSFNTVIYFGDGVWDYQTTTELEIPFIGVDINRDKKLEKVGIQNVINDFVDIEKVIKIIDEINYSKECI
jgi:phosphoglycolate phosphatase-like HAD superfamily hydrolase